MQGRTRRMLLKWKALIRRSQLDSELNDELAFHLAQREQRNLRNGLPPDAARYAARRQFGNLTGAKERTLEMWTFSWLEALRQDLAYAARTLRKSPAFAAI